MLPSGAEAGGRDALSRSRGRGYRRRQRHRAAGLLCHGGRRCARLPSVIWISSAPRPLPRRSAGARARRDYVRRLFTHLKGCSSSMPIPPQSVERFVPIPRKVLEKMVLHRHGNTAEDGELVRSAVEHAFGDRTIVAYQGVSSSRDLQQPGCPPISLSV